MRRRGVRVFIIAKWRPFMCCTTHDRGCAKDTVSRFTLIITFRSFIDSTSLVLPNSHHCRRSLSQGGSVSHLALWLAPRNAQPSIAIEPIATAICPFPCHIATATSFCSTNALSFWSHRTSKNHLSIIDYLLYKPTNKQKRKEIC